MAEEKIPESGDVAKGPSGEGADPTADSPPTGELRPDAPTPEEAVEAAQDAVRDIADSGAEVDETVLDEAAASIKEATDATHPDSGGEGEALGASGEPADFDLPAFGSGSPGAGAQAIDLLADVNLNVTIELGRTRMLVEDVLKLSEGAVVELDKLAGDPVDVYVNNTLVARGEVLVLNDTFCVRINDVIRQGADSVAQAG